METTEDTALVSWDRVQAEVDGYVLTYTSSSEGPGPEVSLGPDSDTYRLTGLRPGVRYTVHVWSVSGDRVSGKSSTEAETGNGMRWIAGGFTIILDLDQGVSCQPDEEANNYYKMDNI